MSMLYKILDKILPEKKQTAGMIWEEGKRITCGCKNAKSQKVKIFEDDETFCNKHYRELCVDYSVPKEERF